MWSARVSNVRSPNGTCDRRARRQWMLATSVEQLDQRLALAAAWTAVRPPLHAPTVSDAIPAAAAFVSEHPALTGSPLDMPPHSTVGANAFLGARSVTDFLNAASLPAHVRNILGQPLPPVLDAGDGYQFLRFERGVVYWRQDLGFMPVYGAIHSEWERFGGSSGGAFGRPVSGELNTRHPDGGRVTHFERGSIYWNAKDWTMPVYGAICATWRAFGGEDSVFGAPVTAELDAPYPGGGRVTHFQRGSIYWTAKDWTMPVYGAIHAAWKASGAENGVFGKPISAEVDAPYPGGGRATHFERGSIYWTAEAWTMPVYGLIYAAWKDRGGERSALGLPTSGELEDPSKPGGRVTRFAGGSIAWHPATGIQVSGSGTDAPPGDGPTLPLQLVIDRRAANGRVLNGFWADGTEVSYAGQLDSVGQVAAITEATVRGRDGISHSFRFDSQGRMVHIESSSGNVFAIEWRSASEQTMIVRLADGSTAIAPVTLRTATPTPSPTLATTPTPTSPSMTKVARIKTAIELSAAAPRAAAIQQPTTLSSGTCKDIGDAVTLFCIANTREGQTAIAIWVSQICAMNPAACPAITTAAASYLAVCNTVGYSPVPGAPNVAELVCEHIERYSNPVTIPQPDPDPPESDPGFLTISPSQVTATVGIGLTDGAASFSVTNTSDDPVTVNVRSSSDKLRIGSTQQIAPRESVRIDITAPWDAFQAEGMESAVLTVEGRRQSAEGPAGDASHSVTVPVAITVHAPRLEATRVITETVPKGPDGRFPVTVRNTGHPSTQLTFAWTDDGSRAEFMRDSIRTTTLRGEQETTVTVRVPTDAASWKDGETQTFRPSLRIDRPTLSPAQGAVPIDMRITVTETQSLTGTFVGFERGRVVIQPPDRPLALPFDATITVLLNIATSDRQVLSDGSNGLLVTGFVTVGLGGRNIEQLPFTSEWSLDESGRNPTGSINASRASESAFLGEVSWDDDFSAVTFPAIADISVQDEDGTTTNVVLPFGPLTLTRTG